LIYFQHHLWKKTFYVGCVRYRGDQPRYRAPLKMWGSEKDLKWKHQLY